MQRTVTKRQVQVIQPTLRTGLMHSTLAPATKQRVAAYARVSTEHEEQQSSYEAQVDYYTRKIMERSDWEFVEVYTDEAQSGTRDTRPEFQRLLNDCRAGKIDRILVKSISRFARNTVTLLATVRELKGLGISVYFEEQQIDTLSGNGEFMLTLLASFAQEESRSVSENCKWRIKKKFEQGVPTGFRMYGYEVRNGIFTVRPDEANVLRRIFQMYLDGMGSEKIMKALIADGIPAPEGGLWNSSVIMMMLRNEKYARALLIQKYFIQEGNRMSRSESATFIGLNECYGLILWSRFEIVTLMSEKQKL